MLTIHYGRLILCNNVFLYLDPLEKFHMTVGETTFVQTRSITINKPQHSLLHIVVYTTTQLRTCWSCCPRVVAVAAYRTPADQSYRRSYRRSCRPPHDRARPAVADHRTSQIHPCLQCKVQRFCHVIIPCLRL